MNKSQFFEMVKNLKFKPQAVNISGKAVFLTTNKSFAITVLVECKTEENAAKECHKFNRWLSEALETIKPSDTSWCPESGSVVYSIDENGKPKAVYVEPNMLEPGYYEAKVKSVNLEDGKITISAEAGDVFLNLPSHCSKQSDILPQYPQFMGRATRVINKQKSPEKMYIRATLKVMKMYDCFDSAKNPHWSNMSKKQKKEWARNFALEILEANVHEMAHDLSVDAGFDGLKNNFSKSVFKGRARQQIIDGLDAADVEDMIEENLNCLW